MAEKVKAIQVGCGLMSQVIMKYLIEKDIEIVGAIDINPEIVGQDIGDYIGLPHAYGIKISDDADKVFSETKADIAIVTTFSYMKEMYPVIRQCVEHDLNVITIGDEAIYPWATSPEEVNHLDRLAHDHNVTVFGTGMQDVYWVNLPSVAMGGVLSATKIEGTISYNVEDYGVDGIDFSASDLSFNEAREAGMYLWNSGYNSAEALCATLDLSVKTIEQKTVAIVLEEDMVSKVMNVEYQAGDTVGMTLTTSVTTHQGIDLQIDCIAKIFDQEENDLCVWTIHGEPTTTVRVDHPATVEHTCATVVNRIPQVLKMSPGYKTVNHWRPAEFSAYPVRK